MNNLAMFPGSFDPPTFGHIDIVNRAVKLFDKVHIVVASNVEKNYLLSVNERCDLLKELFKDNSNIIISSTNNLIINYAKENNINVMVRGLRSVSDFGFEFEMALINKQLYPELEVMFLPTNINNFIIRSSKIKELLKFKADITNMVPEIVYNRLVDKNI